MGIVGLYTFLCENRRQFAEPVDLIRIAQRVKSRGHGPLEIIVDFSAMRHEMGFRIAGRFSQPPYSNPYLTVPAGEYELIYNSLRHILLQLKAAGLKLTFVMDCLKLSNEEEQHLTKHNVWLSRLSSKWKEYSKLMDRLQDEGLQFKPYIDGVSKLPWLDKLLRGLIVEMGFECLTPHGKDGDFYRAQLQRNRRAFAVLTNDHDCVLFPDCPIIPWKMFDERKNLRYNPKLQTRVVAPERLFCGRIVSSRIQRYLQLSSHDQLIDVSNVLGNLFTAPYVTESCLKTPFHTVAEIIRHKPFDVPVEECPDVRKRIKDPQNFKEASINARDYFNLRSDPLKMDASVYANDPIMTFLATPENMLRLGDNPSQLRCRAYWPFRLFEDHRIISHQEALLKFLSRIFAFIHKRQEVNPSSEETNVHVYFRGINSIEVQYFLVQPVASGDGSTVEEIIAENVVENMKRFAEIMNCYRGTEQNSPNEEADRLSDMLNPSDFMRAFLVFCWRLALDVEPEPGYFTDGGHLLALTTSMLTLWDPEVREEALPLLEQLYAVCIVPTPSQVTIFNWMQIITVTANDCALFLYLERFLDPLLPRMFSFSLFLAYVHIRDIDFYLRPELRASLETVQQKVLRNHCDLLQLVPVHEM